MRLVVIIIRASRQVAKHIRGYLVERDDSPFTDALGADQPEAIAIDGGRAGIRWQWPYVSLKDGNGVRWAIWGAWASTIPPAAQDRLRDLLVAHPEHIKILFQRTGQGETLEAFDARWRQESGWPGVDTTLAINRR